MFSYLIFGLSLVGLAVILCVWQLALWRSAKQREQAKQLAYLQRRTVRRLKIGYLLSLAGIVIAFSWWLPTVMVPVAFLFVLVLLVWMLVLAWADFRHTREHFEREHREIRHERGRLESELVAFKRHPQNGQSPSRIRSDGDS